MKREYIHWNSTRKNTISLPLTIVPSPSTFFSKVFHTSAPDTHINSILYMIPCFLYASTSKYKYLSSSPSPLFFYTKGLKLIHLGYLLLHVLATSLVQSIPQSQSLIELIIFHLGGIFHAECSICLDGNFILKSFSGQTPALSLM